MVQVFRRYALPLVAVVASLAFLRPCHGDWLEDALQGWKKITDQTPPCEWKVTVTIRYQGETTVSRVLFKRHRRDSLYMDLGREAGGDGATPVGNRQDEIQVFGRNDRYLFRLSRSGADGDWRLISLIPYTEAVKSLGSDSPMWIPETLRQADRFSRLPVSVEGTLLEELFTSPAVTVESAEPVTSGKDRLYRVVFRSNIETDHLFPKSYTRFDYSKGTIYLDPSHDWRLTKAVLETPRLDERTLVWNYDPTTGFCTKVTTTGGEGESAYVMMREYSGIKRDCRHRPADFTLSAFGIPEPEELRPASHWRWYLLLGFVGAALVIGGMRLLQRRR